MPGFWESFKNVVTGMTQDERDLAALDRELWKLKRILRWNEEFGRRYFQEDDTRAQIATLTRQIAALRQRLPAKSRYKSGPWVEDPFFNSPYRDLEDHIIYLRKAIDGYNVRPKFPVMEAMMRLRLLEEQYGRTARPAYLPVSYVGVPPWQPRNGWSVSTSWGVSSPPQGGIAPITPQGWAPPSPASSGGWGPPSGGAVPIVQDGWCPPSPTSSDGWAPPSGGAQPIDNGWAPPSPTSSDAGWGPPSGDAQPISPGW